ncbi:hypothetical protein NV64_18245 [Erwinia sp. B116]|nr:hypothetical protein NV64_18245 [Erwinia sp. B116]
MPHPGRMLSITSAPGLSEGSGWPWCRLGGRFGVCAWLIGGLGLAMGSLGGRFGVCAWLIGGLGLAMVSLGGRFGVCAWLIGGDIRNADTL